MQPNELLEVIPSKATSYAFTLRKTSTKRGQPTQEDYKSHVTKLCRPTDSMVREYVFEKTGGLHMHGILEIPKSVHMYRFRVRGWKLHLEEIWSLKGWKEYMSKEQNIAYHEDEESELQEDHPIYHLKRSLFKERNTETASIADAIYAPLP